jgi:hypothetical protein
VALNSNILIPLPQALRGLELRATSKSMILVEFGFDIHFANLRPGGGECQIHSDGLLAQLRANARWDEPANVNR